MRSARCSCSWRIPAKSASKQRLLWRGESALQRAAILPTDGRRLIPRPVVSLPQLSPKPHNAETSSIRVSVEKVDELINLVGELVISQSMVNQVIGQIPAEILPVMQGPGPRWIEAP